MDTAVKSSKLMLMRCPAAASRRQGCDLEPQLEMLLTSDDVDEELEMNCASVVTDTTQRRLSCTTVSSNIEYWSHQTTLGTASPVIWLFANGDRDRFICTFYLSCLILEWNCYNLLPARKRTLYGVPRALKKSRPTYPGSEYKSRNQFYMITQTSKIYLSHRCNLLPSNVSGLRSTELLCLGLDSARQHRRSVVMNTSCPKVEVRLQSSQETSDHHSLKLTILGEYSDIFQSSFVPSVLTSSWWPHCSSDSELSSSRTDSTRVLCSPLSQYFHQIVSLHVYLRNLYLWMNIAFLTFLYSIYWLFQRQRASIVSNKQISCTVSSRTIYQWNAKCHSVSYMY